MTTKTPPTKAPPPSSLPKDPTTTRIGGPDRPKADVRVTLAVVVGAHGVAGQVRLKVFGASLAAYRRFNDGALTLVTSSEGNNGLIARFAEISDRTAAEALRGTELTVPRAALPPLDDGEYYHADLLGLRVASTDGGALGHVVAIDDFGAGDVIEIERPSVDGKPGKRFMVPMTRDAVPEWNGERLIIDASFVE